MTRRRTSSLDARRRSARGAAALALAAATLGLSGCQWTSPITTQLHYDASDGVSTQVGDVHVLNALIVATEENGPGNLVGTLENRGTQATTVPVSVAGASVAQVEVPPGQTVKLSDSAAGTFTEVPRVPARPGGMTEVSFGDARADVPVLAPHDPYQSYAPAGATATTSSSPSPTSDTSSPAAGGH